MIAKLTPPLGWVALAAGLAGLVGFALLIAALTAPTPSPTTLRRYEALFRWQDAAVLLQALAMIPVSFGLRRGPPSQSARSDVTATLGVLAQLSLVLALLLRFANVTSDMLYMLPQGLVGLWLLTLSQGPDPLFGRTLLWIGRVAGLGLLVIALGFLIYAAFVAPAVLMRPLSTAEIDSQTWTPANIVGHICIAAGTLLGRAVYPLWTLMVGLWLLRDRADSSE